MTLLRSKGRIVAFCAFLAALSAAGALQASTLHRGIGGEPGTIDPQLANGEWEAIVIEDLFAGLTAQDAQGNTIPGLAKSWIVSADKTRYTLTLRDDAKWSDGKPVTAEDVVFGFRRALDPATASPNASLLYIIKNGAAINAGKLSVDQLGVRAPDKDTIVIDLNEPAPYFLQLLAHPVTYPVPKRLVEKFGKDWIKADHIVTDGAYKFVEWVPQLKIRAVRNPDFYDAKSVKIDQVDYFTLEDSSAALQRFRAGEFDITYGLPLDRLDWLKANMPDALHIAPALAVFYCTFNTTKPPFNDKRVRVALSMLLERKVLTDHILRTGAKPAYALVPPGIKNYGEPVRASFASLDPAERLKEARKLLAEAGYGPSNPLHVTLRYNTSGNAKRIVTAMAAMWKRAGVETDLLNAEVTVHFSALREGDFEAGLAGWIADYNDPQDFLLLFGDKTGAINYSRYDSPAFDAAMREASETTVLTRRAAFLREAEVTAVEDAPVAPLWYGVSASLVSKAVKGWVDNLESVHPTRYLSLDRQ